jgi:aspartate-semialdehyde dehydrogenase
MVKCLEERKFKLDKLKLLDKQRIGEEVSTAFGKVKVEDFSLESAQECDICFFAVADEVSKEYGMKVAGGPKNTVVIDNSSVFRYTDGVPLVIPEINMAAAKGQRTSRTRTALQRSEPWPSIPSTKSTRSRAC